MKTQKPKPVVQKPTAVDVVENDEPTLAQCIEGIESVLGEIKSHEGFATGLYYDLGEWLGIVKEQKYYTDEQQPRTLQEWCDAHGINTTYRSRAEGIYEIYPSREVAAATPLPQAIDRLNKARAKERGGPKISVEALVGRRLGAIDSQIATIVKDVEEFTAEQIDKVKDKIASLVEKVELLAEKAHLVTDLV